MCGSSICSYGQLRITETVTADTCINTEIWNKIRVSVRDVLNHNDILLEQRTISNRLINTQNRDIQLKSEIIGSQQDKITVMNSRIMKLEKISQKALNDLKREKSNRIYYIAGGALSVLILVIAL